MAPMSERNCWSTPASLFDPLHAEHQFTVDAAANATNTKLPRYWDETTNGLKQDWRYERVWCNPPYGKGLIEPWVRHVLRYKLEDLHAVLLLPSRTDTAWFQELYSRNGYDIRIDFLPKRVRFVPPPGVVASSPTEASILVKVGTATWHA